MSTPEVPALTPEQTEQLRLAAAKAGEALAAFASAFADAMSKVDWKGLAERLAEIQQKAGTDDVL